MIPLLMAGAVRSHLELVRASGLSSLAAGTSGLSSLGAGASGLPSVPVLLRPVCQCSFFLPIHFGPEVDV